jgi:hypothetical protein
VAGDVVDVDEVGPVRGVVGEVYHQGHYLQFSSLSPKIVVIDNSRDENWAAAEEGVGAAEKMTQNGVGMESWRGSVV